MTLISSPDGFSTFSPRITSTSIKLPSEPSGFWLVAMYFRCLMSEWLMHNPDSMPSWKLNPTTLFLYLSCDDVQVELDPRRHVLFEPLSPSPSHIELEVEHRRVFVFDFNTLLLLFYIRLLIGVIRGHDFVDRRLPVLFTSDRVKRHQYDSKFIRDFNRVFFTEFTRYINNSCVFEE